jgi:hypothetical protein
MVTHCGILHCLPVPSDSAHVIISNGATLPVTHTGAAYFPTTSPLYLNNILVFPSLVKKIVSVRALTRDNPVTIEFDAYGFSIKDLRTGTVLSVVIPAASSTLFAQAPRLSTTASPPTLPPLCGMLVLDISATTP